jgi:dienelactone hydrolase
MTNSFRIRRPLPARRVAVATLALLLGAATAKADMVSVSEMLRGVSKTRAQCNATPQAVWVSAMGRNFCMRYYLAKSGTGGGKPVVFLQGDRLGVLNLRTGAFAVPDSERDINTDDLVKVALSLSKQTKDTALYLARVGLEGSSGDHRMRHSVLELNATNAALEAIKKRYKYDGFHLLGQSGGAHLVAGLLGLRDDIGCAVIGSGPLAPTRRVGYGDDPALEHFNPANNLPAILRNHTGRIIVITDTADKKVSADKQALFVRTLQLAGRPVEHYFVQALDENHHGVVAYSRLAMTNCLKGAKPEEIAAEVEKLVQTRVAANRQKPVRRLNAARQNAATRGDTQDPSNSRVPKAYDVGK